MDQNISSIFLGQTLRVSHGMDEQYETIVVTNILSSTVSGILLCGAKRGSNVDIQKLEIAHCKEVFGSPLLHNLLKAVKQLEWEKAVHSKTRNIPKRRPKLNASFFVPPDGQYKRK